MEETKQLFECTTQEIAILKKLRVLKYGKLYVIVNAGKLLRISVVHQYNLDEQTIKEIVLEEEKNN